MQQILILSTLILLCLVGEGRTGQTGAAVATAHPLATDAGMAVIADGGNAVDVAIAVSLALSVVEPWSSGIGGGAFMVVRMQGETRTWDFRETAPLAASRDMFVKDGKVVPGLSTRTALASGIPGLVRGLAAIHRTYGSLPFARLVAPAVQLAKKGFPVSQRLHEALALNRDGLNDEGRKIFLRRGGEIPAVGSLLKQSDLGRTLTRIGQTKGEDFYTGRVAKELVRSVRSEGGLWTENDLKGYQVKERPPVMGTFRGYAVHSMGPPSSGGLLLVQMLGVRELINSGLKPGQKGYAHEMAETTKRAFALRATGLGDPDHVAVKWEGFTSRTVAERIASAVRAAKRATPAASIGKVKVRPLERGDTSHFGVLFSNGDAVACTQTINLRFGSGLVAGRTGVVLNNEMDDFSALPGTPNAFGLIGDEANSIAPGKRPLSSMTPTLIVKDGQTVGVFGSPGGSRIITTTYQSILNVIEHGWDVTKAISHPRMHHQWFPDAIFFEVDRFSKEAAKKLEGRGHKLMQSAPMGNAMGIWRGGDGRIRAAADPRGEGTARNAP
jgi:gamma-glutamyltranspeptidase / glutathione hydrolase